MRGRTPTRSPTTGPSYALRHRVTSLHKLHEEEVKALLDIPEQVETMALIPLGWPKGRFGTPTRLPVEKVVYWEKWAQRRER